MNQRLRIGLIGAGGIVKSRHLPNLKRVAAIELVAVSNRRPESAQEVAREWGVGRVEPDWRAVVAADDVDAVLIGTPPLLHKAIAVAALEAGKHVFCQARMARTYAEAWAMLAAERRASLRGLKAQLCLAPDGLAVDKTVRRLLHEERVLGRLLGGVVTAASGAYLDPAVPVHWRQSWAVSGYNTLSLGIIVEVVHRWLGEFRRVSALTATHTAHWPAPNGDRLLPVERPDLVAISAEHCTGAVFSLHFSGVSRGARGGIELHGTDASLRYHWGESVVWINRGGDWEGIEVPPDQQTPWTAEADFVHCTLHDEPIRYPNPTFADGVRYMAFTEAVFRSAETGCAVDLPLPDPVQ